MPHVDRRDATLTLPPLSSFEQAKLAPSTHAAYQGPLERHKDRSQEMIAPGNNADIACRVMGDPRSGRQQYIPAAKD